jgi:hypothetical protein
LADRAIFLNLTPIGEKQRRSEAELWREFECQRPLVLGALLDAAVHGLRAIGSVSSHHLPRMADFALWARACETGLWPAGTFNRAYSNNQKAVIRSTIDADPIATLVRELMSERTLWTGCAADLLRVGIQRENQNSYSGSWPKNPRALAGRLRRAQTFLRAIGIDVGFSREGPAGNRIISIRHSYDEAIGSVSTVSTVSMAGEKADGVPGGRAAT